MPSSTRRGTVLVSLAAVLVLLPSSAAAETQRSLDPTATEVSAALHGAARKAADKLNAEGIPARATTAKKKKRKKKTKRIPLSLYTAQAITQDTAFYVYLDTYDATSYGAESCSYTSRYSATCVGWIGGYLDFDPYFPYLCDWYQDVWINAKNQYGTYAYQPACYAI